jgi:hypothetical protein
MVAFFYELDRNVESVDDFFTKKSSDMQRRLKLLIDKYGDSRSDQLDYHELEDLVNFFLISLKTGRRPDGPALPNAETFSTYHRHASNHSGTPMLTNEASQRF